MGTHPNGHSTLVDSDTTLEEWIEANPQALGSVVLDKFGVKLPFLFKVLSVQNALSIQSHPDKELAKKLHLDNPKVYKDPNHKPEMAIALSAFEALSGFESFEDIVRALDGYPELESCVGEDSIHAMKHATPTTQKQALELLFTNLMTCPEEVYGHAIDAMLERIKTKADKTISAKDELLLTLNEQYPRDVGILAACLLNYVCLNEGEALYLEANEPHAYISGEIVECMATSDNVIRAGLTPKMRDTSILCKSLTYNMGSLALMEGERVGDCATRYSPPFEEFEVLKIDVHANATHILEQDQGPSLLLVYQGEAIIHQKEVESSPDVECNVGDVFFVPSTIALEIKTKPNLEKCILWQAKIIDSILKRREPAFVKMRSFNYGLGICVLF